MKIGKNIFVTIIVFMILILIGTIVYHQVEGWRVLDSMYFTVITVTTIGFGDFTPKTDTGKIFTMFFSISGIAIAFYLISIIAKKFFRKRISLPRKEMSRLGLTRKAREKRIKQKA